MRHLRTGVAVLSATWTLLGTAHAADSGKSFRPPSVPLVTHDPYFSVWSPADRLTDAWSVHWTGTTHPICGLIRVDGKPFRFSGIAPRDVPPMQQVSLEITPTRTLYRMEGGGVRLNLTFCSPLLVHDLELLGRSVSYVICEVASLDDQAHHVELYLDATAEWAVNKPDQEVTWSRVRMGELDALRVGTQAQPVLGKKGDDLRIDWGYLYVAAAREPGVEQAIAEDVRCRDGFARKGSLPASDDLKMPRPAGYHWPVFATVMRLPKVDATPQQRALLIGYDDLYAIELFQRRLRPYWRRNGAEMSDQLQAAHRETAAILQRCVTFDESLMADLRRAGGPRYASLCALAYRQCLAAHKLAADFDGTPLMFSKENFSNGCIATVDVIYPACPFFLLFNTRLLEAQLRPVLDYASSPRWRWPFAPHDLGTYPLANGQVYGGGERTETDQMPVEETGNMLLMLAAMARVDGHARLAEKYWPTLEKWAVFLREKGMDPENQLCTDDFMGHLAHNANLSIKAILALGAFGQLCEATGRKEAAATYHGLARDMAARWKEMAADGDHTRLAFDKPGTWSQKYNLVWDRLLGLELFDPRLARSEVAFYRSRLNKYGLPLDNRGDGTKSDWQIWTATLAQTAEDFEALTDPVYRFLQDTPDRVPFTDWYSTTSGKKVGFQARSVIGGVFIKMLADEPTWRKWAAPHRP